MPNFSRLELKNFKSYKNEVCVEWMQFSSIIGPNGSGKSSIVDAIEFVFCFPRYSKMSVQTLRKEICNEDNNKNDSSTWVKVTFDFNGKKEIFKRLADYSKSVYRYSVNNKIVNTKEYKNHLLKYNINTKANHFLVQQNFIENIAMKGGKERSEFFERMCNSIVYKEEYVCLNRELNEIIVEIGTIKKNLNFQYKLRKSLTKTKKEVQRLNQLKQELANIEFEYNFSKLYEIDKSIEELYDNQNETSSKIKVVQKIRHSKECAITEFNNNIKSEEERLKELEDEAEIAKDKLLKYSSKMSELKQKITHCENSMNKIEKNLIQAEKVDKARKEHILDLKRQYNEVEESKENYEKSQSLSCSLQLQDEQYEEYLQLKSEAQQKFAKECGFFDNIERERDSIETNLAEIRNENKIKFLSEQISQEKLQINEISLEIDSINEKILDKETVESRIQETHNEVEIELENLTKEAEDTIEVIEHLGREISDSNLSKQEERKFKTKQDVLSKLKFNFPGVHDRLKNLYNITAERYQIPVMKILGKKMDNIVVDNRFTANKCIQFLKKTYAGDKFSIFETFLPLDYIPKKSLENEILGKISYERNVRLASTVIATRSDDLKRLLEHYFNVETIIICETDEAASDLSFRKKLNCVSLNGTYYKRDGSFSGGLANLLQQLRKWNHKEYVDLKEKKQRHHDDLQELQKLIMEKRNDKDTLMTELEQVQKVLNKHLRPFLKRKITEMKIKSKKLSELEIDLLTLKTNPKIQELQKKLDAKNDELEKIENKKNAIEDEIFARFCENFHIANIRQYEQGDFKIHKESIARKKDYEIHLDKIRNEIKFEKNRDTKTMIKNLKVNLNELKDAHQNLKQNENKLIKLIAKNKASSSNENELKNIRQKIDTINKEIKSANIECKAMKRDLTEWNLSINSTAIKISNLVTEKHKLIFNCKINNIKIPLCRGTIDKVLLKPTANVTAAESSTDSGSPMSNESQIKEKELEINYSSLSDSIKNLENDDLYKHIVSLKDKQTTILKQLEDFCPKMQSKENQKLVQEKIKLLNNDYNKKQEEFGTIKKKFDDIKNKRIEKFNEFYNSVAEEIDNIFKTLYKNPMAQAFITVQNSEEPYLDGIEFNCIIPHKQFILMENLSGGEKTMSAIALLLAMYRVKPAPFLIFDEIDGALDNSNINKIAYHFSKLKQKTQIINISHHALLSRYADSIIGINKSSKTNSSYVIHLEISQFQKQTLPEKCLKNNLHIKPLLLKARLENSSNTEESDT